ncbi:CheY-like protein, partial [Lizonia empirigonia]
PSPNAAATNPPTPFTKATSSKRTQRILLVDDNTINLRLLQVGVRKRGYTAISSAQHGLEAVNTYRSLLHATPPSPPNIILMDLSMPVMNGFEATRQIREIEAEYNAKLEDGQAPHHALIIALTGLASIRDQKEAYTCGVDSYIMKPVSFAKLTKSLDDW